MTEINWTPVQSISPGIHRARLVHINSALGLRSNKPMFVWTFQLDEGQLIDLRTSKRGEGARKGYEASKALGLSRHFTPSEAVGRECRVEIALRDGWLNIERVLPL